jgi:hypothetical protein
MMPGLFLSVAISNDWRKNSRLAAKLANCLQIIEQGVQKDRNCPQHCDGNPFIHYRQR